MSRGWRIPINPIQKLIGSSGAAFRGKRNRIPKTVVPAPRIF
jgi:hypothetical protein